MASTCRGVLRLAFFSALTHTVLSFLSIKKPILIDCGSASPTFDTVTNSSWGIDQYFAGGSSHNITTAYADGLSATPQIATLRAFPNGTDPCYHIPVPIGRFLVRLTWAYKNYDGLNAPPIFGVLFDSTQSDFVDFSALQNDTEPYVFGDYLVYANTTLQICFFGSQGTPFINSIAVYPLDTEAYEASYFGKNVVLNLAVRLNGGGPSITGYPTDLGYRSWLPDKDATAVPYMPISTTRAISSCGPAAAPNYLPCEMFQTARQGVAAQKNTTSFGISNIVPVSPSNEWLLHLYFAEIDGTVKPGERVFYVILASYGDASQVGEGFDIAAQVGLFNATAIEIPFRFPPNYVQDTFMFGLLKANGSTYNPILSGFELYEVIRNSPVNASTVEAELISGTYINANPAILTIGGGQVGGGGGLNTGAVIGIILACIGGLLFLALLLFLLCQCCGKRGGNGTRGGGFGVLRTRSFGRSLGGEEGEAVGPYQQGFHDNNIQMSGR